MATYPKSVKRGLLKKGFFNMDRKKRIALSLKALERMREKFEGDADAALALVSCTPAPKKSHRA